MPPRELPSHWCVSNKRKCENFLTQPPNLGKKCQTRLRTPWEAAQNTHHTVAFLFQHLFPIGEFVGRQFKIDLQRGLQIVDAETLDTTLDILARGNHPNSWKNAPRMLGQMKFFMWVPVNLGNHSGSCSENCGFRIAQVVGCHSENGISYSENGISNSESCSQNTPERSQSSENGLFSPRAFFLKLGWSAGFWDMEFHVTLLEWKTKACLMVMNKDLPHRMVFARMSRYLFNCFWCSSDCLICKKCHWTVSLQRVQMQI